MKTGLGLSYFLRPSNGRIQLTVFKYLHIVNVAVKPAVERPEFGAHQDEGRGDLGSLQESVQIIHHPGEQQQLICVGTKNRDTAQKNWGGGGYLFSL